MDNVCYKVVSYGPIQAALMKGAEAAIEPAKGFLKRLLGPAVDEAALLLQDKVRLYRLQNQIAILARAEQMLADAHLQPGDVQLKHLLPVLEAASLENNIELQERWAALIANASISDNFQLLFVEMLRRLSSSEARFLDALYEIVAARIAETHGTAAPLRNYIQEVDLGDWLHLMDVYVTRGLNRLDLVHVPWAEARLSPELNRIYRDFAITLDKFLREAILWRKQLQETTSGDRNHYIVTVVGIEFVLACRGPRTAKQ
jgi:hypothetical protein